MGQPVTLYATPDDPTCALARAFLQARGVAFTELDPATDGRIVRELLRLAGAAVVPTVVVGEDVQVGWDASRLAEMIDDPLPDEVDELAVLFGEIEDHLDREEREAAERETGESDEDAQV